MIVSMKIFCWDGLILYGMFCWETCNWNYHKKAVVLLKSVAAFIASLCQYERQWRKMMFRNMRAEVIQIAMWRNTPTYLWSKGLGASQVWPDFHYKVVQFFMANLLKDPDWTHPQNSGCTLRVCSQNSLALLVSLCSINNDSQTVRISPVSRICICAIQSLRKLHTWTQTDLISVLLENNLNHIQSFITSPTSFVC